MNTITTELKYPLNTFVKCSDEEYRAAPGLNCSKAKDILKSPRHFYSRHILNEGIKEETEALRFGRVIHQALLEPEVFHARKLVEPKCDKRTTEGKKTYADYMASVKPDSILCTEQDLVSVLGMQCTLEMHPFNKTIKLADKENAVWWHDHATGVLCKARLDCINQFDNAVIDLKTTEDAAQLWFNRQAVNFKYHMQAAWYLRALHAVVGNTANPSFYFAVVEKQAPFEMMVYRAGSSLLNAGENLARLALSTYKLCTETGDWPGYDREIKTLEMP